MSRVIEILLYKLKPGTGAEFFEIMQRESVPLHHQQDIDVVWHGRSLEHADGYGLIRAFADLPELERVEAAFYASVAWREGPRAAIVSRIETASKIVVPMQEAAITALRAQGNFPGAAEEGPSPEAGPER